jgi:uncharacterized protein (TIGR03382 family)
VPLRPRALFAAAALTVLAAGSASANGRFPKAQQIVTAPGSGGRTIFLRATFGVLVSRDAGASFTWLCEQAMGFSGTWDPPIAATRDGRLWMGLPDGLSSTRDGCDVVRAPELAGEIVVDLATEPDGERVVVVTSTPGKPAFVWRRPSAKAPFARLGAGVTGVSFDTVDVAAGNPKRLYATAAPVGGGRRAHLFRSDDGGATLTELDVHLERDGRLFLSAIDPKDPDRIFVRHTNELGTDLLLSKDGGKTFTSVLRTKTSMFGFAATADGASLFAGAGDADEGVFRSKDRGVTWEPASKTSVLCLWADGASVFACSNPFARGGWAIAISRDDAASFRPLATFGDVRGAVACDAGAGAACAALWSDVRAQVVAPAPSVAPDAGAEITDAVSDAGGATLPAKRACGCGASGAGGSSALAFGVLLALALAVRRLDRS